jgi:hypothetical protein
MIIKRLILVLLCVFAFLVNNVLATEHMQNLQNMLTPAQMKEDINAWQGFVNKTHPDLSIRIKNPAAFDKSLTAFKQSITKPMSVNEFLSKFALLNSQFNDAHMLVFTRSQKGLAKEVINNAGLFPFEVTVKNGKVYLASLLGGQHSPLAKAEVISINEKPIKDIYTDLIARMYGDTVKHRERLLSDKFALFYWLFVSKGDQFKLTLQNGTISQTVEMPASKTLPKSFNGKSFEQTFKFEVLDQQQALLTIDAFWWRDKPRFYQFTENVFKQLKEKQIEHLIIDIRNNGGGDDDMWKQGIVKYIANKPYQHTSKYTKKIIAKYMDEGETEGDVVTKVFDRFEQPVNDEPLKFSGKVSVVVGSYTYSSAILFANTMQDFGFAEIVGEASAGYSWQTGGIQFLTLPNSQLKAVAPRFYLVRPSGKQLGLPVIPNKAFQDNVLKPQQLINTIMNEFNAPAN